MRIRRPGTARPGIVRRVAAVLCGAAALVLAFQLQARAAVDSDLQAVDEQLQTFVDTLGSLEAFGPLADALPLGDALPGEALDLAAAAADLKQALADEIPSLEDAGDLVSALDGLDGTYAGVEVAVDGPNGDPVIVNDGTSVVDVILQITATREVDVPLDFATGLVDLIAAGGSTDGTFPVDLTLATSVLHFELDKALAASEATIGQAFSLRTLTANPAVDPAQAPSLSLTAKTDNATLDDFTTNLGFTAVTVDGSLSFDLSTLLAIGDPDDPTPFDGVPNGDQRISADEWTATALDDLVQVSVQDDPATDAVKAEITLDTDLTVADPDVTITYLDASLLDAVTPTPTLDPATPSIADLRNFSAEEALAAVGRLVSWLRALQSSGRLDVDLPFISGIPNDVADPTDVDAHTGSFSDALSIADALQGTIDDATSGIGAIVDDGAPPAETQPTPTFSNAQELAGKLGDLLGITIEPVWDVANKRLEFELELGDSSSGATQLDFGNLDVLSSIGLDAGDAIAQIDADYDLALDFALDLTAQPTEDGGPIGSCTDGVDNGADDLDDATPADGGDAGDTECAGTDTLEQRVAVQVGTSNSPELTAHMGISMDDLDASARIGMLEAAITDGTLAVATADGEDGVGPASCVDGSDDDGDGDTDLADEDCRALLTLDINESGGDGWLTIEDLINAMGATPPAGVTIGGALDAALDAVVPVSATLGATPVGSGAITASAAYAGPLNGDTLGEFVESLDIDASAVHATDLMAFSPCGNTLDDDGDGTVNDGCGNPGDPDAVDESEASSLAMLTQILAGLRGLAESLDAGGLLPAGTLDAPIPFLGASFNDLLSYGDTLLSLATNIEDAGEQTLVDAGLDDNACSDNEDSDYDGVVDDGCPTAPGENNLPETDCRDADGVGDDDGDGDTNDGCPATIPSLQHLSEQLDGYLTNLLDQIDDSDGPGGVTVGNDTVSASLTFDAANDDLIFGLDIVDLTIDRNIPFNLELPGDISQLVALDTSGELALDVVGDLSLDFGIELDDFTPFLLETTSATIAATGAITDIQFGAGVGPLRILVGEPTATGEDTLGFPCDDGVDDDGDGTADDCGASAAADRGRFHIGGQLSIEQDDVAGTATKAYLPGGPSPTAGFTLDAGGTPQAECEDVITADTPKHACAVLPLYFDNGGSIVPIGSYPTGNKVLATVEDLGDAFDGTPADAVDVSYDTTQLESFIQDQLIDLLLFNSGLGDLLDRLQQFLNDTLLSFPLPLIGDKLDDAASLVQSLKDGLKTAVEQSMNGTNPLSSGGLTPRADFVQSTVQTLASAIGEKLDGDGNADLMALLLDTNGDTVVDETDVAASLKCGDGGSRDCDTGFGEDDDANPALPDGDDLTDNCTGNADDDGDGVANDGCAPVADPETACEAGTEEEPDLDDDGDGTPDDGCDGSAAVAGPDGDPETICDADANDDTDDVANDGCAAVAEPAANVSDIQLRATLGKHDIGLGSIPLNFDKSIPGLGLKVDNAFLNGDIDWDIDFGFGISKDLGFYFLTDDADEIFLHAGVQVSAPGTSAHLEGTIAFLTLTADDIVGDGDGPSALSADFRVNVLDPNATGGADRLTFGDLQSITSFGQLLQYSLTAGVNVDVQLATGFDGDVGLPQLRAQLHLGWTWGIGSMTSDLNKLDPDACGDGSSCLQLSLDNVELSLGSFITNFLKPVFGDIQRFTKPFDPIIEKLNAPIPVLSDLAGEPITLLTLAETFGPSDQNYDLIIAVVKLVDFINSLDFTGPDILIPLGGSLGDVFSLDAPKLQNKKLDPTQARQAYTTNIDGLADMLTKPGGINDGAGSKGSSELKVSGLKDIGVSFPFLENPSKMLGILFGQDVDLIVWEPPPLSIGFSYSQKFGPIWAVPPVFLEIGGSVSVTGTFGIGYSSKGLRAAFFDDEGPAGLLRGLFLVDRHPLEGGPDSNELELRGELFANAQVSVVIFSAGAQGSVFLTIGIDLQDPNSDGRLEYSEAADVIRTTGNVLCIFNLNGQFGVEISVFAEVDLFFWSQRWSKTLAKIILYEFKVECDPLADPILATQDGGTLKLNIGPRRHLRDSDGDGTPNDSVGFDVTNEQFVVTKVGDGLVTVSGLGYVQPYGSSAAKITKVEADGGTGNDVVTLADGVIGEETECADLGESTLAALDDDGDGVANDGCQPAGPDGQDPLEGESDCADIVDDDGDGFVNDGCKTVGDPVPFTGITGDLDGGPGKDQITASLDADTIDGDGGAAVPGYDSGLPAADKADGDDQLNGREGVNTIHGNGGHDTITSGAANDKLFGDAGNDTIDAGLGGDEVEGGDGEDAIDGGRSTAATTVQPGKPGQPQSAVADGADTIYGDVKADSSIGARDTIDAGDGGDTVYGGPGGDRINGDKGNDTIEGGDEPGDADCLAPSNDPDDVIVGGPGADTIKAQGGDDIVLGGSIIAGQQDEGDTLLDGGDQCDVVIGDNATFASSTDPRSFTPVDPTIGGGDTIKGGNHADVIQGQVGVDFINGDDTGDASDTDDGGDVIRADDGDDIVQGDGGNDKVYGGIGDDDIAGGNGDDQLFGDAGVDLILGDNGSVAKNGAGRSDDDATMDGGTGVDTIRGGSEPDKVYGQGSGDTIYGDNGTDELYGDGDDAVASHVAADGNDTIFGGIHDDLIYGNNGADTLYGESGDDRIGGGSPNATSADDGHRLSTGAACVPPADGCFQDRIFGDFGVDVLTGDNATFGAPGATPTLLAEATIGGNDLIYGQGFDDKLYGENGDDDVYGGGGDDHAEGGDDSDDLFGEADQDDLIGGTTEHADVIPAGATNGQPDGGDRLYGGGNADVLAGDNAEITRPGGNHPSGANKRDVTIDDLDFGAGNLSGNDELSGEMAGDELYGGAEDDELWGFNETNGPSPSLDGDDHLEGNDGSDDLFGNGGQDDLIGGTSAEAGPLGDSGGAHPDVDDVLRGGDGHDVMTGDNASIQIVLNVTPDPDEYFLDDLDVDRGIVDVVRRRVVLYDIATVAAPILDVGRSGGDQLWGEGDHDQGYGQGGDDLLDGGASDDHLEGNAGEDVAYGQGGQDDIIGGTGRTISDDPTTASDRRLDEGDDLFGGDGGAGDGAHLDDDYDVVMGDNATVLRGSEQGTLGAAWTINTFNASVKRYLFLYDVAEVGKTPQANDLAMGPDLMRGQADDDVMYGQGDGDDMEGGGGDDYMEGNDDADTMSGQAGNDDMLGGTGPINTDPPTGVDGRHDRGELGMSGGSGYDWMAGDNAVIRRVLDEDGAWVPSTFNGGVDHLRIWLRDVNSPDQDVVSGGDVMNGDGDDDVMYGQANGDDAGDDVNDVLHGNGGDDYQEGNAGADLLFGDDQQDDQIGGTGLINDDPPTGVDGRWDLGDTINGGNHADFQLGDNGKIERPLDGDGLWTYFVEYNPTTVQRVASRFDVAGAAVAFGNDVMNGDPGDDYQWGQDGNDVMHGNDDNDDMYGELGDDQMWGDRGQDAMVGDRGRIVDTAIVGDGSEVAYDTQGPAFFVYVGLVDGQLDRRVTLTDDGDGAPFPSMGMTVGGKDRMRGGPGHDSMHGAFGDDLMNGDSGGDFLFGHDGADVMWGGKGADPTSGDPADTPTPEDGTGVNGPATIRGVNDRFVDIVFGGHGGLQADEVEAADILDFLPRAPGEGFTGDPVTWFEMTSTDDADPSNDQYHQGIDWIYGGWNRDVLEADVGKNGPDFGDRLMDWVGAFNLFTRCNASYGDDGDIRQVSPQMIQLLWTMAYGSGAGVDLAEVQTEGTSAFRELGLVYPGDKFNNGKAFPTTPGHYQLISCTPGTAPA